MVHNIAYHTEYDISSPDGPGTNELEFTRLLAEAFGKNAWCVLPKPKDPVAHLAETNVIHCEPQPRVRNLPGYVFRTFLLARRIARLVRENGIDLVAVRLSSFPLLPYLLQHVFRVPVAVKTLGEWWPIAPASGLAGKVVQAVYSATVRAVIRNAVAVDTGLQILLKRLGELGVPQARATLIPNAANTDLFHPEASRPTHMNLPDSGPIIGYLGSLPSRRGAREAVQAAASLKEEFPDISVVVAGWDEGMPEVEQLANSLGVADRCHFLGWIPYEDAPGTICAFDLALSFFETECIETIGNCSQKVRQYLACGKPVVSIRQGHGFLEEHDLGSVVDPANMDQVAEAVRYWVHATRAEPQRVAGRIRDYAVQHLSTRKAFADRLQFWDDRLKGTTE